MIKTLIPNLRWLCLPSENSGKDWYEKSLDLDSRLEGLGLELAEESVYLIFSHPPQDVLECRGSCLIARSVIGPKRPLEKPLSMIDKTAGQVWLEKTSGNNLEDILMSAGQGLSTRPEKGRQGGFTLRIRRELSSTGLNLSVESIFQE